MFHGLNMIEVPCESEMHGSVLERLYCQVEGSLKVFVEHIELQWLDSKIIFALRRLSER